MLKKKNFILLALILFFGLLIRLYFVNKFVQGDILAQAEWGERYWEVGPKNFYFDENWYYTFPTQPPLMNIIYAFSYWIYDQRFFLPQLHNLIKIPPAFFIVYFYDWGYFLILKLWGILADFALGVMVYTIVKQLIKKDKIALIATAFFVLNPVTIFLSSIWGQTDSLASAFGLLSFWLLAKHKPLFSLPAMAVSLFIKPTWVVLLPFYLVILLFIRPKVNRVLLGTLISFLIFYVTTNHFAEDNFWEFTRNIVFENMLPSAKGGARTSISAFNFFTIFQRIDSVLVNSKIIFISSQLFGYIAFTIINLITFYYLTKSKSSIFHKTIAGIFIISLGGFLFMTNMLERYFFAAFASMIILGFINRKYLKYVILINTVMLGNTIWAYFRRNVGSIDHVFTDDNFMILKLFSLLIVTCYLIMFAKIVKFQKLFNLKLLSKNK